MALILQKLNLQTTQRKETPDSQLQVKVLNKCHMLLHNMILN